MRPAGRAVGAVLAAALVLAGCGASARQEVQAKVQEFAHDTAAHDYAGLCRDILAPSLVDRLEAAGLSCVQAMRVFATSVQDPSISVGKVEVTGHTASVVVLATAAGQPAALESVQLLDTANGWRLVSLASPR